MKKSLKRFFERNFFFKKKKSKKGKKKLKSKIWETALNLRQLMITYHKLCYLTFDNS